MKYINAALSAIVADLWGAILLVFVPALVLEFFGAFLSSALEPSGGAYIAFIFVDIPTLCLIVFLIAEGGAVDLVALWESLRIVYPQAIPLGIILTIPKLGLEIALKGFGERSELFAILMRMGDLGLQFGALLVAVPLVQRRRGLLDAMAAARETVKRDFAGIAAAVGFLIALSFAILVVASISAEIGPLILPIYIAAVAPLLLFVHVLAAYTFVQIFE